MNFPNKPLFLLAILLPATYMLGKWFCKGYYEIDPSFAYVNNSITDDELILSQRNGFSLRTVKIPVPEDKFESVIHSWLLTPDTLPPEGDFFPIVVMSHGIGGQKDMGLLRYGEEFVNAGFAVLIFDYRHFGGSFANKKAPFRNFIYPWNHYEDIMTVVRFIKSNALQGFLVNSNKIALWGTSFAGGHVIMASSELPPNSISAVISQVPHMNGREATKSAIASRGLLQSFRVVLLGIADILFSQLLQLSPPLYVKIAAKKEENEIGYMSLSQEHFDLYISKHPKVYLGGWKNLAPARTLLFLSLYNPVEKLENFTAAPVLFVTAKQDDLCPPKFVVDSVAKAQNQGSSLLTHVQVDTNHFGIYNGKHFEESVTAMKTFLSKHLK